MDICIDFDGTCVTHNFPEIGKDIGAIPVLKELVAAGHRFILFTMRSNSKEPKSYDKEIISNAGMYLSDALIWFEENKIPLFGTALGIPLIIDKHARPYVDWIKVRHLLCKMKLIN